MKKLISKQNISMAEACGAYAIARVLTYLL